MEINNLALLAGGLATRLKPVTETIPKSMLDVAGIPFIHHQLNILKNKGIKKVVICAGAMGEQIKSYTDSNPLEGMEIIFSFDGEKLLGTGGALKKALSKLNENFFVMYGDSYLDTDFNDINKYFLDQNKKGLMTVFRNEGKWDISNIEFENGKILNYDKFSKNENMRHIDYGLGILTQSAFKNFSNEEVFDLAEVYKLLLKNNELAGFEVMERFYEIGSFSGLEETRKLLSKI
ncbi:MAG TPA: sugar phosphate nucleotidyltransferase [Ignavibacteria bacterium]|nr:sugar phosphate nucleotidyltransferase [Ignavibacteria bacterium]HRA99076.1 sugar phosphate nucleotidyltransferase [Ignavibacteria bacterium]